MIQYFWQDDNDKHIGVTTGCGCCSSNIYVDDDREEIIDELKRNLSVIEEGCNILGITIDELKGNKKIDYTTNI